MTKRTLNTSIFYSYRVLAQLNPLDEAKKQRLLIMEHALLFFYIWDSAHDEATADSPIQRSRPPPLEARIHSASSDKTSHT